MSKKSWAHKKPDKAVTAVTAEIKDAIKIVLDRVKFPIDDLDQWMVFVPDVLQTLKERYTRWDSFKEELHVLKNPVYAHVYHTTRNSVRSRDNEAQDANEEEKGPIEDESCTVSEIEGVSEDESL